MPVPDAPKKSRTNEAASRHRQQQEINGSEDSDVVIASSQEADTPFTMYFVRIPNGHQDEPTQEETNHQNIVFEMLVDSGIDPQWIDVENVFELEKQGDFFVVPMFRGSFFERLCQISSRVYGPPIVADCVEKEVQLPQWDHPVYSNVFANTRVCFTGIEPSQRKILQEKVKRMNGLVSDKLYENMTHLVTNRAESKSEKYKEAIRSGMTLMKSDWINELWEATKVTRGLSAFDKTFIRTHRLPVFAGMVMTLSNVVGDDRVNLCQLIESHGGEATMRMMRTSCTHLITDKMVGDKYKKATEWGSIRIVQVRWIRKCIDVGYVVDERKFHPKMLTIESIKSSTPRKDSTFDQTVPDVSSIAGPGGRLNISVNTSSILTPSTFSTMVHKQRVYERNSHLSTSNVSNSVANATEARNKSIVRQDSFHDTNRKLRPCNKAVLSGSSSNSQTTNANDPIDEIDITGIDDFDFLEGCMVWLCGIEDRNVDKWRRVLDRTGATRVQKIEACTHAVVVRAGASEKNVIHRVSNRNDIHVVTPRWIVECYRARDFLPSDDFLWAEESGTESESANQMPYEIIRNENVPTPLTSRLSENRIVEPVLHKRESIVKMDGIFASYNFVLHDSISAELKAVLENIIVSNSGKVVTEDRRSVNFCVFHHSALISQVLALDAVTAVSAFFVQSCDRVQAMLSIASHPLFVPMPQHPLNIFTRMSIDVVSPDGYENEIVRELVKKNGGALATPSTTTVNTIIVCMETKEYERMKRVAERRKIVDISWIIDCITKHVAFGVEDYLFEEEPLKGYTGRCDEIWDKCIRETCTSTQDLHSEKAVILERASYGSRTESCGPISRIGSSSGSHKMNLNLSGVSQIIDAMPSPTTDAEETASTTLIGKILKKAVENTARTSGSMSGGFSRGETGKIATTSNREEEIEPQKERSWRSTLMASSIPTPKRSRLESEPQKTRESLVNMSFSSIPRRNEGQMEDSFDRPVAESMSSRLHRQDDARMEKPRRFLLSMGSKIDPAIREHMKQEVLGLGGSLVDDYTSECTHIICVKMMRSPKTLSAIAAGKWCLVPEYLDESVKAGRWLPEAQFEWNCARLRPDSADVEVKLSKYCRVWREHISSLPMVDSNRWEHNGAFYGWRCVFIAEDQRALAVISILRAGGAIVNTVTDYMDVLDKNPTIVFASKEFSWNAQSAARLREAGVPLVKFDFIYEYLVHDIGTLHPDEFKHSAIM